MDILHDHSVLGAQKALKGSKGLLLPYPQTQVFSYLCVFGLWRPLSPFTSHDHIDFGPHIPFLGSEGLFSDFWPLKIYIFFIYTKISFDWWIKWPISFLNPLVPSLFFWAKNRFSIKLQSVLCYFISEIYLGF
jgi:hypothetical protein